MLTGSYCVFGTCSYTIGKERPSSLNGTISNFSVFEAPTSSFLYYSFSSFFFPSEGKCLGKCESTSIFFLVNSFHMINCRKLNWNPLKLKSQPTWMLRSKGFEHNKFTDIQQREFSETFVVDCRLLWVHMDSFACFSILLA